MQRKELPRAQEILAEAETQCNQLKALWTVNTDKLGPLANNIEVCRCLTMTYNNLGVLNKQDFKNNVAIRYLKRVLELEAQMVNCPTQANDMAQSYINICSIYSEMRKHEIALHYIQKAVTILDREYERKYPHSMGDDLEKVKFASVVSTAFHNAAVEYEFMDDYSTSLIYY